jgi:GAF domain-containing protein
MRAMIARHGAKSATLYVRDPHWTTGFRLVAMPGVRYTEPMHGFNFAIGFAMDKPDCERERYQSLSGRAGQQPKLDIDLPSDKADQARLFDSFIAREGVRAAARLAYPADPSRRVVMVFFLNFSRARKFDAAIKRELREFVDGGLAPLIGEITSELEQADARALAKSVRILSPDRTIAIQDVEMMSKGVTRYLESILRNTFDAFSMDPAVDIGSIYRFDPERRKLHRCALVGDVPNPAESDERTVAHGEGIVSWVALRQTGLLVSDLAPGMSAFASIHMDIKKGMRSELAVPMILGEEVVGVICLESATAGKFTSEDVRPIWYAANRAAVACRFYEHLSLNRELLRLCIDATTGAADAQGALDKLASQAVQHLSGSQCVIWRFDHAAGRFVEAGTSYENPNPPVRHDGWSRYIIKHKCPVWLHGIVDGENFKAAYFENAAWSDRAPGAGQPTQLNEMAIRAKSKCELGLPVRVGGDCIGVAWITYRHRERAIPTSGLMTQALGFAAQAALLLETLASRKERPPRASIESGIRDHMGGLWQLGDHPLVEAAYATRAAEATLGGDFFSGVRVDDSRFGVLIGDGTGHATPGSYNMLALWGAFRALRESCSTVHVVERMAQVAAEVGVGGSALYGIVTDLDGRISLSATSAGHAPFLVLRRVVGGDYDHKTVPQPGGTGHGTNFTDKPGRYDAYQHNLRAGDILIAYTDGVVDDQLLTRDRVAAITSEGIEEEMTVKALADAILAEALRLQGQNDKLDDATVIVVRVKNTRR